ncbi:hypothetical protein L6164_024350 [Bauhinia variegata]|uniref:Uncharacterized protein n=1 Tax=Bauhinia variegata TaxID=167791 RepID=A0ACB9LX70_BAUVA|nr:hypothetical protein L6164_024350 [Bauhinia variegata]
MGSRVDNRESRLNYAKLISSHDNLSNHVNGTKHFKLEVYEKVQLELNHFGHLIYNANIKQPADMPGHKYNSLIWIRRPKLKQQNKLSTWIEQFIGPTMEEKTLTAVLREMKEIAGVYCTGCCHQLGWAPSPREIPES